MLLGITIGGLKGSERLSHPASVKTAEPPLESMRNAFVGSFHYHR